MLLKYVVTALIESLPGIYQYQWQEINGPCDATDVVNVTFIQIPIANAGIEIDRGSSANASLLWDETGDRWVYSSDGATFYGIADAARLDAAFIAANTAGTSANNGVLTFKVYLLLLSTKFILSTGAFPAKSCNMSKSRIVFI